MRGSIIGLAVAIIMVTANPLSAYSVLSHEATIDVTWDKLLEPLLKQRFPRASAEDLVRARSFAYGGSVIQDLGYYPFGNKFFSNLVHYVRSGDFVEALLRDARDVDEFAFALGALAHYANDTSGHPEAVNVTVPVVFPKLQRKYGNVVTYAQAPHQHVIVEFSFDIVHAVGGAFLPDTYKRFIGFRVATPLLERAVRETYGLEMRDLFADLDRSISTYRYSVSHHSDLDRSCVARQTRRDRQADAVDRSRCVRVFISTGRVRERLRARLPASRTLRAVYRSALSHLAQSRAAEAAVVQGANTRSRRALRKEFS